MLTVHPAWWIVVMLTFAIAGVLYWGLRNRAAPPGATGPRPPIELPVAVLGIGVELLLGLLALGQPRVGPPPPPGGVAGATVIDLGPVLVAIDGLGESVRSLGETLATPAAPVYALGGSWFSQPLFATAISAFVALLVL